MPSLVNVAIHRSQFPENVRRDLIESLRARLVNHKFHYDSIKQTQKWLALHQAYSPSRKEAECAAVYEQSFVEAEARMEAARGSEKSEIRNPKSETNSKERKFGNQENKAGVWVIGLGCGGGQKDTRLLKLLRDAGKAVRYVPVDVSTAMVLVAQQTVIAAIPQMDIAFEKPRAAEDCRRRREESFAGSADRKRTPHVVSYNVCSPLVCDLATADDLPAVFDDLCANQPSWPRLFTFFGMLPNFEPQLILPRLAGLLRSGDNLLLSANLAPGADYAAGVRRILPLYNNALTRDWLMTFLLDLGIEKKDGEMDFVVEDEPPGSGLKRVAVWFRFVRAREVQLDEHEFEFLTGDAISLFFSYRHTPTQVQKLLEPHGLRVLEQWITKSEEEGVFLVERG